MTPLLRVLFTNGSGLITKSEFEFMLHDLNLDQIRTPVVESMLDLIDIWEDDTESQGYDIKFEEFRRFLAADSVHELLPSNPNHPLRKKKVVVDAGPAEEVVDLVPPTRQEIYDAHRFITETMKNRFKTLTRAFRLIDEDHTGYISRQEFRHAIELLNLNILRKPVLEAMISLIDERDDGGAEAGKEIHYNEFAKYMSADDIFEAATDEQIEEVTTRWQPRPPSPPPPSPIRPPPPREKKVPKPPPKRRTLRELAAPKNRDEYMQRALAEGGYPSRSPRSPRHRGADILVTANALRASEEWKLLKSSAERAMASGAAAAGAAAAAAVVDAKQKRRTELIAKVKPKRLRKVQLLVKQKMIEKFATLTDAFKTIDVDRTGTISTEELRFTIEKTLNLTSDEDEFRALEALMDTDMDGTVDYREFAAAISVAVTERTMQEQLATSANSNLYQKGTNEFRDNLKISELRGTAG